MTTSLYSPDVKVEVAFNAGYVTPAADRIWTDVSDYVELKEGVTITNGRADERATAEANTLSLTLDNKDGRFTPGRASSPYYPNVKVGRPIRVLATPAGGVETVRFVGFVDEWPLEWNGTDTYASATITASSRLARLGTNATISNFVEAEYLTDDPWAYYQLNGPAETTGQRIDLEANGSGATVAFDAMGVLTDGINSARFVGGKVLFAQFAAATPTPYTIEFVMQTTTKSCDVLTSYPASTLGIDPVYYVKITSAGKLQVGSFSVTPAFNWSATGSKVVTDGRLHHVQLTDDGTTVKLRVDGVSDLSTANSWIPGWLAIGGTWTDSLSTYSATHYTGVLAHFAIHRSVLSNARNLAHAELTTFGQDPAETHERMSLIAGYAGIPATEYAIDATATTLVQSSELAGALAIDFLRTAEAAEGGVLFDDRDGTLTYRSRSSRYVEAVGVTLDMASQQVETSVRPRLDLSTLINDISVTMTNSDSIVVREYDQDSLDEYGIYATSAELELTTRDDLTDYATWQISTYSEPAARIPDLGVEVMALSDAAQVEDIFAARVGTLIDVTGWPTQAGEEWFGGGFFVEGWSESIGLESYTFTFNVSPRSIAAVWQLGVVGRTELGETTRLGR